LLKWNFVVIPFVDEETNGSYMFANGLNGLDGFARLCLNGSLEFCHKSSAISTLMPGERPDVKHHFSEASIVAKPGKTYMVC
jgi:hypothetical protein